MVRCTVIALPILALAAGCRAGDGTANPGLPSEGKPMADDALHVEMERIVGAATNDRGVGALRRYGREDLCRYMNGAAERYLGYSFERLLVARAERGDEQFVIELYHFGVPSDAYGIWSTDSPGERVGVGQDSAYGGGLLQFWRGSYFVRVYHSKYDTEARDTILAIGRALAKAIPGDAEPPALLAELPAAGIQGDPVFFHEQPMLNSLYFLSDENILRLGPEVDALFAEYGEGEAKAKLLLVRYSGDEGAEARKTFVEEYLEQEPQPGPQGARLEDGLWTAISQPKERLLRIVLEATTRDLALKLLKPPASQ